MADVPRRTMASMHTAAKWEIASAPPAVLLETCVRGVAPKPTTAIRPESWVSSTLRWGSWQVYDRTASARLVGLDYFGARYFSGAQGRFMSPDWSETQQPVPYADLTDPQTLNLYSYVRNNPLSKTDPDGHCGFFANAGHAPSDCSVGQFLKSLPDRFVGGLKAEANAAADMFLGDHGPRFQPSNPEQADVMGNMDDTTKGLFQQGLAIAIPGPKGIKGEVIEPEVAPNFDAARTTAFEKAGMTDPANVKFSRVDPKTGTIVEFKGPKNAEVNYDGPHQTPGAAHDTNHIGWQEGGKGAKSGNIPYKGPQHPSRGRTTEGKLDPPQ